MKFLIVLNIVVVIDLCLYFKFFVLSVGNVIDVMLFFDVRCKYFVIKDFMIYKYKFCLLNLMFF